MDQVTIPRELLQQILSFVEEGNPGHIADKINVLVKLRTALEQPAVEPVHPRHPFVAHWINSGIEACAGIAEAYGNTDAARDMRGLVTTAPQAQPAPRKHITDGSTCWCNPETVYTDPDTGASVIVHKEPQ